MREIMNLGAIYVSMKCAKSFMFHADDSIVQPYKEGETGKAHAVVFFGWGEENGQKFWWAKNSWGEGPGTEKIFRIARGVDAANVESMGVGWIESTPLGHRTRVATFSSRPPTTKAFVLRICLASLFGRTSLKETTLASSLHASPKIRNLDATSRLRGLPI